MRSLRWEHAWRPRTRNRIRLISTSHLPRVRYTKGQRLAHGAEIKTSGLVSARFRVAISFSQFVKRGNGILLVRRGKLTCRKSRGLTLIETMLSLIMLSLLIVGLLGLLGSLLVSSTKSSDTTGGTYAAQYLLDQATTGDPPVGGVEEGVKSLRTHELEHPLNYQYRLEWTLVGPLKRYTPVSGTTRDTQFGTQLFHVKATVWWMVENPEDGRAEGGGKRTVTMERLIKVGKV